MAKRRLFTLVVGCSLALSMVLSFQNCGNNYQFMATGALSNASTAVLSVSSGSINVDASHPNPPLDLFFIIDNSASMLGHQINLGNAFASVFQSNLASLSNFDVNVYVLSTASTNSGSYVGLVPQTPTAPLTSLPSYSNFASLPLIPGSVFSFSGATTGTFGVAPFSVQYSPAPLLGADPLSGAITPSLFIAKQGAQSNAEYAAHIAALTLGFQNRIADLDPTNQLAYQPLTDISSGLCSIARVLKHSANFVKPGDSGAFIIVSDDNDRLNDRNPNNNQCVDSILGGAEVVDGSCGHNETTFSYDSTNSLSYVSDAKFAYQSGTQINFSYPTSSTCNVTYDNGYNYSYTLTSTVVQTTVTYTQCTEMADGVCLATQPGAIQTISGSYAGASGVCTQDVSGLVATPAVGSTFNCVQSNTSSQVTGTGVDTNSNGSVCSSQVLSQLAASKPDTSNVVCTIGSVSTASLSVSGQALNSCSSYCSGAGSKYPNCVLTSTKNSSTNSSVKFPGFNGLTCDSQCPVGGPAACTSTIGSYVTSQYPDAICSAPTAIVSTLQVSSAVNPDGSALTCSSSLGSLSASVSGSAVCAGASTVQSCISSLQKGATTISPCAGVAGDTATLAAPVDVTCSTTCANSNGLCSSSAYATVAAFVAGTKSGLCVSNTDGGAKTLALQFTAAIGTNASCSSNCSDTLSGSCDGQGFGASGGVTVAEYIQQKLGGSASCTSSTKSVSDGPSQAVAAASTATACPTTASPLFIPTSTPHPQSTTTNYVAGDVNHLAADFQSFIATQSAAVFGANNLPAMAVITHLSTDKTLVGTDVGTDYVNLANLMNSTQVSSITGNYAQSLGALSNFIVTSAQNSFVLAIPSSSTLVSLSVLRSGQQSAQTISSSLWSLSGETLSVNLSLKLQIGDQLIYTYK